MKYSNTALKELSARYGKILRKCALLNAAILLTASLSIPANAAEIMEGQKFIGGINSDSKNQNAAGLTITYGDALNNNGVNNVEFVNNQSVNSGAAMKALNGFTAGNNWTFDDNHSDKASGGLYIKIPNSGTENRNVSFGSETTFSNNSSKWLGGALGIEAADTVTLGDNAVFDTNHSDADGGAIAVWTDSTNTNVTSGTTLNLGKTEFKNNTATNRGGALANLNNDTIATSYFNTVNIGSGSSFTNNSAIQGGAIYNKGTMNIGSGTEFSNNTTTSMGGSIFNDSTGVIGDIANTSFKNNNATAYKGSDVAGTSDVFAQGAAIYNKGSIGNISGDFIGNTAKTQSETATKATANGGALALYQSTIDSITGNFKNNSAIAEIVGSDHNYASDMISGSKLVSAGGGAIHIEGKWASGQDTKIGDITGNFVNNKATGDAYANGGAIYIKAGPNTDVSIDTITGDFTNNSAVATTTDTDVEKASTGGAISSKISGDKNATVNVIGNFTGNFVSTNVTNALGGAVYNEGDFGVSGNFTNNKVISQSGSALGGAIYNTGDFTVNSGSQFSGNSAVQGGAIYNKGTMNIADTTFSGNSSNGTGGAIHNLANRTINLSGTNTFSGNTAGGVKNDIHNDGTLNVSGLLALDGGITGTGTVNFLDGSSLKAALNSETAIITAGTITGQTAFVLETGSEGGTIKLEGTQDSFSFASNSLYDITNENGTYTFAKKDSAAIAESTGATGVVADTIAAVTSGTSSLDEFNVVAENINTMLQSSDTEVVAAGVQAAKALAQVEAPVVQAQVTQTVSQILAAAGSRLSGGSTVSTGESSGDFALGKGSVWAKGLYNKSKYSGTDGFDAYSRGIALGAEAQITDSVKVGLGYAYTNSDIKPDLRKTDIDSNSALLYGEYKPNNWYVNGIASYTWGRYDEHRYATTDVSGKYDVNTIALQAMTGYDIHMDALTFTPEAGLRYMNIDQKAYTDSIGSHIAGNSSDIFTGVLGAKAVYDWNITDNILLKPQVRAAITYDFVRDNATAVMSLANGSVIATDSKALKRFGTEFAVGLTTDIADNLEMGIFWEGKFRNDYTDNTGMINVKYNF